MKRIDLHIHSNLSDGELSPKEIIDEAVKNGVTTISITDHDTIDAYTEEVFEYAKSKGIELVKGVEVSTNYYGIGIHVLAYNFDLDNKEFKDVLKKLKNARHDYLFDVTKRLREIGYIVNFEKLDSIDVVTKAHISLDIIENKENEELLINTFGHIPKKGEFIEGIMNENCIAYVEKASITPMEASKYIKNANGKVILAHPVAYKNQDKIEEDKIKNLIINMNADGVETKYILFDQEGNRINEVELWSKFAKENNLIQTIGSDFHRRDGLHPVIGLLNEDVDLFEKDADRIIENILN